MGTLNASLAIPPGDGSAAPSDTSRFAARKTIIVAGTFRGVVKVEASGGGGFCEVATFARAGVRTATISAQSMRVTLEDYISGTPAVFIVAEESSNTALALDVPAGTGVGSSSDATALGDEISTFVSGGLFKGTVAIEVSGDNVEFSQPDDSFTAPGCRKLFLGPAAFLRVRRRGAGGAVPAVHVSAQDSSLTATVHKELDQLVHNIAESSFEEVTYTVDNQVAAITVWTDNSKTTKIRECVFTYANGNIASAQTTQYDDDGNPITGEIMTETYTYNAELLQNIDRVIS